MQDTPDNADALRWLATVYYDLGDIENTLQMLNEVCRVAPQDYRPHQMQGVIYRDFGEYQKAIAELRQALELAGEAAIQAEVRPLLASAQMSLKQFDAALVTRAGGAPRRSAPWEMWPGKPSPEGIEHPLATCGTPSGFVPCERLALECATGGRDPGL